MLLCRPYRMLDRAALLLRCNALLLQICLFYGAICWTESLKWQETSALHLRAE